MRPLLSLKSFSRFLMVLLIVQLSIGFFALPVNQAKAAGTTYYVSNCGSVIGNDSSSGTSSSTPWLTIAHVNAQIFNHGDSVLFNNGCIWREELMPPTSGSAGSPITFGAYNGNGTTTLPIISGADVFSSWTPQTATSTVVGTSTQANMKLSTVTSTAFVDFNASGTLTPYIGDQLTITDSASNTLIGYIKAAGTGETYGSQLLVDPGMDTVGDFFSSSASLTILSSGCYPGGNGKCLRVTPTTTYAAAFQHFTPPPIGALVRNSVYAKAGTESGAMDFYVLDNSYNPLNDVWFSPPTLWTQEVLYNTIINAGGEDSYGSETVGQTALWSTASSTQVLTPSPTGVTITTISNGSTYNWTSEASGFNPNDSNGYTYSILTSTSTVYYASYSTAPTQVFEDGNRLTQNTVSSSSLALGQWFLDTGASRIWVRLTGDDAPTGHTIEASQRQLVVDIGDGNGYTGVSYVTVNGLQAEMANGGYGNIELLHANTSHIIIANVTSSYSDNDGIKVDTGVAGADIVIESSTVYGNETGINFYLYTGGASGHENYVQNNQVYLNAADGIGVTGNYITVQNNYVHDEGTSVLDAIGIHVYDTGNHTYGQNNIIRYNLITNTTLAPMEAGETDHSGIETDDGTGYNEIYGNVIFGNQGPCLDIFSSNHESIFNNTCYGDLLNSSFPSGHAEILLTEAASTTNSTNDVIEDNIAYATGGNYAIYVDSGSASNPQTIANNLLYAPGSTNWYYWSSGGGNNLATFNGFAGVSNNLYSNPLFVSTSTNNFALTSSSPAIDAGLNLGTTYDMGLDPASTWPSNIILDNQNSNGKGWEIGAYVYPNQATLSVTTSTALSFPVSYGSVATSSQPVVITNTGPASSTLNWSATSTNPWLTFSPASSSLGGGASTTVNFIVNPAGMPLGVTSTVATLSDPNASSSPQTLPVTLTISATTSTPPQTLTATPGNAQVALSWQAPSSTGGSAITGYLINDKLAASSTYALASTTGATSTVITGLTNGALYDFEALAQNGVGTSTPSNVATATPQSNDATLSNLMISAGTLTPTFSSSTTSYTDSVSNNVTSVTVTPTATQASSTITVNSSTVVSGSASSPIPLNVGSNTVLTVVTAQNGVAQDTYTITVTRTNVPSVVMTAPTSTTVSGIVTVSASSTAVSPASIASVQFYLDGSPLGSPLTTTSSPNTYSYSWNTASSTNASHTLYALTTDNYSNTATSTSITVTVQNQAFLSVPTSTLTFSAAHGSIATSSQSVVIMNNGTAFTNLNWSASSTQSWLTFSKSSSSIAGGASTSVAVIVNPTGLALGTYDATATIADPNASSSPHTIPVSLTVSATGIGTSIASPSNGATLSGIVTIAATATSTVGISSVQFYLDGTLIGTATSSPYTASWNAYVAANGSHTLYALATDNDANTATSSVITVTVANAPSTIISVGSGYGIPNYGIVPSPTPTPPTSSSLPSPSSSGTTSPSLAAQIEALQHQLAALLAEANASAPSTPAASSIFSRNLSLWMIGNDVQALQQFLISQASGPAAARLAQHGPTTMFGSLTYRALVEFQEKVGIKPASGYFGPKTRAYVNKLSE
jgi:hypothetical protein